METTYTFKGIRFSSAKNQMKKIALNVATRYNTGLHFKLFRFPDLVVELRNILIRRMGIGVGVKNHLQPPSTMFFQQIILKITI